MPAPAIDMLDIHGTHTPIGLFDSGVGGLSILREIRRLLPSENLIYVADQAHVPYGNRSLEEVQSFADGISRFLFGMHAKLIVIACNAASAAALKYLRNKYENIPFVGMEPAVKPAAEQTQTQIVGVLATQATFQGALYASVIERFAQSVRLYEDTCPGLVAQIEKGELDTPQTRRILEKAIHPMLEKGIDTIVLGCTHYPFVIPLIKEIAGTKVNVIDPAPAVARQVMRLLETTHELNDKSQTGNIRIFTTGSQKDLKKLLPVLTGLDMDVGSLLWEEDQSGAIRIVNPVARS